LHCKEKRGWPVFRILAVTSAAVRRAKTITNAEVRASGIPTEQIDKWRQWHHPDDVHGVAFGETWQPIYARRGFGWDSNPWGWFVGVKGAGT
jgi:hypothetical protein